MMVAPQHGCGVAFDSAEGALTNKTSDDNRTSCKHIEMVRPWLKDGNGKKKKFGGPKKQLAAAETRKLTGKARFHGIKRQRKRGHGWTTKKRSQK
jgi:hypothetical protein